MRKPFTRIVSLMLAGTLAVGAPSALLAAAPPSYADPAASTASASDAQSGSESSESASSDATQDGAKDAAKTDKQLQEETKKAGEKAKKASEESKSDDADSADAAHTNRKPAKKGGKASREAARLGKAELAKQKEIARAAAYLQTLNTKLETATEELQQIKAKRKKAEKKAKAAKEQLGSAKVDYARARKSLNSTVKEIYENGDLSFLSVIFGANNFDDFASRLYLLEDIATQREGTMMSAKSLKQDYEGKLAAYQKDVQAVKDLEREASERKETITDSIASQMKLIGSLDSSMLSLVNSRDTYKASQKFLAKYAGSKSKKGSHPEIVKIAAEYLGVPYVWGGETPNGFDCSGLTMYCYAKIGIELPHFARSQYDCGKHISEDALMPGDLVFFGPDVEGIHHVGIYVGDGKYIQAPRTGDVVKVSSLSDRSDYVGACRPGA